MAEKGTRPLLFARETSGLVREVNRVHALFFNVAAFVGLSVGWLFAFYPFGQEWQLGGISAYAYAIFTSGLFAVAFGLIYVGLTVAMPRSGGGYVFTSRILGPSYGWLESWTLVWAALAIVGFEVPLTVVNLKLLAQIWGLAFPAAGAETVIRILSSRPGQILTGFGVLSLCGYLATRPPRIFHRLVTVLAVFGTACFGLMFFSGFLISRSAFEAALPATIGMSAHDIIEQARRAGWSLGHLTWSGFAPLLSMGLMNFMGFQFSSYIAGEVKGEVKRVAQFAILTALGFAVFQGTFYIDFLASRFGFELVNAWGYLFWNTSLAPLGGAPPLKPLLGQVALPGLWPLWLIVQLGTLTFNFLLNPVYLVFISRIVLAWAMDRRIPEWFAEVDPHLHLPLRPMLVALGITALLFLSTVYGWNPAQTLWFGVVMSAGTYILPGFNAFLIRRRRPELLRLAAYRETLLGRPKLEWLGVIWLGFSLPVFTLVVLWPLLRELAGQAQARSMASFLQTSGLGAALALILLGIAVYLAVERRHRRRGIDSRALFREIPPD